MTEKFCPEYMDLKKRQAEAKLCKQKHMEELQTLSEDDLFKKYKENYNRRNELFLEREQIDNEESKIESETSMIDTIAATNPKYNYDRFVDYSNSQ